MFDHPEGIADEEDVKAAFVQEPCPGVGVGGEGCDGFGGGSFLEDAGDFGVGVLR